MSGLDVRDTCRISGTATKQMIAAISKQVRKDIVRFPKSTPSDVTFKGTRLDENDNDVEYNDDFVDTGGFEASGIGKPAEPPSFHPVERPQSPFGEFAVCVVDDGADDNGNGDDDILLKASLHFLLESASYPANQHTN